MPKVYVVQEPMRRDRNTGAMERLIDISPAQRYGDIEILLPSYGLPLQPDTWVPALRGALSEFSDDDFLLPAGDLTAIVAAAAIASDLNGGRVNLLKWDRASRTYIKQEINARGARQTRIGEPA